MVWASNIRFIKNHEKFPDMAFITDERYWEYCIFNPYAHNIEWIFLKQRNTVLSGYDTFLPIPRNYATDFGKYSPRCERAFHPQSMTAWMCDIVPDGRY